MAEDFGLQTGLGAEGIKDAIAKILAQRLAAAQLAEQKRANIANEDYRNRDLMLRSLTRADALAEKKAQDIKDTIATRGLGDPVTEGEFQKETAAGVPSSVYKITPGPRVVSVAGFSTLPTGKEGSQIGVAPTQADVIGDRKSTRLNSSHVSESRMPSSA